MHTGRTGKIGKDDEAMNTEMDKQADDNLSEAERIKLEQLRADADRLMLRKAHAAALLYWRGYTIPPADKLRTK
jgi:hypothetical protein